MAEDIKRKAQSIGADAQITKPEMHKLLDTLVDLLEKTSRKTVKAS
jgi:hypothetical protein